MYLFQLMQTIILFFEYLDVMWTNVDHITLYNMLAAK